MTTTYETNNHDTARYDAVPAARFNPNQYDARSYGADPYEAARYNADVAVNYQTVPTTSHRDANAEATPSNYSAGIDQVRYWVGAGITAVVAALVGVVGLIVAHGIIHVPVMFGSGTALSPIHAVAYGLAAAGITLGAAALFDGMLHVAPRPALYFSWLIALFTALAAVLPFTTTAVLGSQITVAAMNVGVGLIVMILVPLAAVNARR
jgi:hypothetical protein